MLNFVKRRYKRPAQVLGPYIVAAAAVTSIVLLIQWTNFCILFQQTRHLAFIVASDSNRARDTRMLAARQYWRVMTLEERYTQAECRRRARNATKPNDARAWITALGNDAVALPAIVSGHTIRMFSCERRMIALVSRAVSETTRAALVAVGYEIIVVESLDCNWMDVQEGRSKRNLGFPGTYMRLYIWSYEWLKKAVYFDPDMMFLSRVDELFDINSDFAAVHSNPPGVVGICFNAGLLVIKPNMTSFRNIMSYWRAKTTSQNCPNDQVLLCNYFRRWTPIPYVYNSRRRVYHPLKVFHFAGDRFYDKPWRVCPRPSRKTAFEFDRPLTEVRDLYMVWWRYAYEAIDAYKLESWWSQHPLQKTCHRSY